MAKEITYKKLQEKYSGKIIALSKTRDKVLITADDSIELVERLFEQNIKISDVIITGPISETESADVY